MKKYLYLLGFIAIGVLFSGCVTKTVTFKDSGSYFSISSDIENTKVFTGTNKDNLELYCTTPCYRYKELNDLSHKYFQGRKEGYFDSEVIELPRVSTDNLHKINFKMEADTQIKARLVAFEKAKTQNSILVYEQFIESYPDTQEAEIAFILLENNKENKDISDNFLLFLNKKDIAGLLDYINSSSDILAFAKTQPKVRLLLSGPQELQVGKILQYKKYGLSDDLLNSKIQNLHKPYQKFSLEDMKILIDLGISDVLLISMLDVTTAYEKENRQLKIQQDILKTQKKIAKENKDTKIVYQDSEFVEENNLGDVVTSVIVAKVVEAAIKSLHK